ncbi:hypothetical protein LFADAHJC_LOCUS2500 [Methylorubrum extorquens]
MVNGSQGQGQDGEARTRRQRVNVSGTIAEMGFPIHGQVP